MKELLLKLANSLGWAYWVEITTDSPNCTYYFGPFLSTKEAQKSQDGYIEDLLDEKAVGIKTSIKQIKPDRLTLFEETEAEANFQGIPLFGR